MAVIVKIVKLGNSKGIRIPKPLLQTSHLSGEVEMETAPGAITIRAKNHSRSGREKRFRAAAKDGGKPKEDTTWQSTGNEFDEAEWTW